MSIKIDTSRNEIIFQHEKNRFKDLKDVIDAVNLRLEKLNFKADFIFKKREIIDATTSRSTFQILTNGRQIKWIH